MGKLNVNDSGTWRGVDLNVNDSGTWRALQSLWVNDAGTWRQIYNRRAAETVSITAGQNGTGGAYGRSTAPNYGSIIGSTLTDLNIVRALHDTNPIAAGGDGHLQITGFSVVPPPSYFSSITANGVTNLASAATYTDLGSNIARWEWPSSPFNFLAGITYNPCTINF